MIICINSKELNEIKKIGDAKTLILYKYIVKKGGEDGFIPLIIKDVKKDLGFTRRELDRCRKELAKHGIIEMEVRMFKVVWVKIIKKL